MKKSNNKPKKHLKNKNMQHEHANSPMSCKTPKQHFSSGVFIVNTPQPFINYFNIVIGMDNKTFIHTVQLFNDSPNWFFGFLRWCFAVFGSINLLNVLDDFQYVAENNFRLFHIADIQCCMVLLLHQFSWYLSKRITVFASFVLFVCEKIYFWCGKP